MFRQLYSHIQNLYGGYCVSFHSLCLCWNFFFYFAQTLDSSQQTAHVGDIRQAVRFAVSDLKGQELLPGFCLPKVNSSSDCKNSSRPMFASVFLIYVLYCGTFV